MINEEDIKVINKCDSISGDYTLNFQQKITNNNLEEIFLKQMDEYHISNIKIKEGFIIIISTKISKNIFKTNPNDKNLNIIGFDIRLIDLNLKNEDTKDEKREININIPLKEAKSIANNNLLNKYFFYDFIKIDESKNYLHIYIFGQLHIFKIYLKDHQLKYNKIELRKFNEKTKVLYLGENYKTKENILEIALLFKPINSFMFLEIDTNEKGSKIVEKKYEFKNQNAKNILNKFIRSYCGIFLFSEKETNKKFIIYKEDKDTDIQIKEANIHLSDNFNNYFYSISDKLYLICELPPEKLDENNFNYIVLGIFHLFNDEDNDVYQSKLIQKIMIKNEGGIKDYYININTANYISINIGEMLFFFHLNENSSVDMVNKINLNSKNLQISRIISDKSNDCCILLSYINSKLYLSKLYDDKENISKGKCIINYDTISNEDENENEEEDEKEEEENSEIEEKESSKESEKEENNNTKNKENEKDNSNINLMNQNIEYYIDKLIKEKIKVNNEKMEELKREYEQKFELIQKDIDLQEKENDKLEKNMKDVLARVAELEGINGNNKNKEDEKENVNDNSKYLRKKNTMFKNDVMNFYQYNNLRQWNQMKLMSQFNLMNPENLFINSQMHLNDPRLFQILQQNRSAMNQGNFYFKNKINDKNEFPLNK